METADLKREVHMTVVATLPPERIPRASPCCLLGSYRAQMFFTNSKKIVQQLFWNSQKRIRIGHHQLHHFLYSADFLSEQSSFQMLKNWYKRTQSRATVIRDTVYPLANPLSPIFLPISPTVTPGRGSNVEQSRTWTTNIWIPWLHPFVINWAYTMACVAALPRLPIQNLIASRSGVWRTKPC